MKQDKHGMIQMKRNVKWLHESIFTILLISGHSDTSLGRGSCGFVIQRRLRSTYPPWEKGQCFIMFVLWWNTDASGLLLDNKAVHMVQEVTEWFEQCNAIKHQWEVMWSEVFYKLSSRSKRCINCFSWKGFMHIAHRCSINMRKARNSVNNEIWWKHTGALSNNLDKPQIKMLTCQSPAVTSVLWSCHQLRYII